MARKVVKSETAVKLAKLTRQQHLLAKLLTLCETREFDWLLSEDGVATVIEIYILGGCSGWKRLEPSKLCAKKK